jgi:glutathione S-transferase
LQRAKINFFVDTWFSKVNGGFFGILRAGPEEKEAEIEKFVASIVKEIEPLLQNANPFFGGASKLTLAEVCITAEFPQKVSRVANVDRS